MAGEAARPGEAGDAIGGVIPRAVHAPASVAEAAEVLRSAAAARQRLAFLGGGTDLGTGAAPAALDAVVRTARLARIVEYAPSDQIVVAEAGVTLAALQAALGRERQRLALDPPWPERATLGGVVAANAYGALRTRYGSVRDLLIGATLVRAEGTVVKSGGKVVKNVAGFDVARLMVGSLGTLAMVAVANFRVHPLPEVVETVVVPGLAPGAVWGLVRALRGARLEPAATAALGAVARLDLGVRFEGFEKGVRDQAARAVEIAAAAGHDPVRGEAAAAFWGRHDARRRAGPVRLRVQAVPAALEAVARAALAPLEALLADAGVVWYPALGTGFVSGAPAAPAELAGAVAGARRALAAAGGTLTVAAAPAELAPAPDPWGPQPPAFALMRALKERFDPERRLAPGRFVGGL